MNKSFLPRYPFFVLFFLGVLFGYVNFYCALVLFFISCIYLIFLVLFIKPSIRINNDSSFSNIQSPLSGVVNHISGCENGNIIIRCKVGIWDRYGICFPNTLEVFDIFNSKKGSLCCNIVLRDDAHNEVKLVFKKNFFGFLPKLFIVPGDKGQTGANAGFFPFGGTVLLYLSENYEIMVNVGDKISIGKLLAKR